MDALWNEIASEFPNSEQFVRVTFRISLAALVGAIPGLQRELAGVAAGLRTHMMVSVGAAVFVIAALESGASIDDTTRVIQGLATGIGFVGAGAILKSQDDKAIRGLTTASSIWLTAGLGTAAGLGRTWLPVFGTLLAFLILSAIRWIEVRLGNPRKADDAP